MLPGLADLDLPPMHLVRQRFAGAAIADVAAAVRAQFARAAIAGRIRAGQRVAVAVGSRGIAELPTLVATAVAELKRLGAIPFIVPAMGSHGGATADGQRGVLASLGVTEASAGAPIRSAMEVTTLGRLRWDGAAYTRDDVGGGIPICVDAAAWSEADIVIPIARIKPHTGFRGPVESGLCKMLAIGLAKHIGCAGLHRQGYARFAALIPAAAAVVLESGRVPFSLAVVEDAHDRTALVEAVPAESTPAREAELLTSARTMLPRILLPRVDVLVVERIGKDVSGVGMDANVIGRSELGRLAGFDGPDIGRIVVLGLTEATHGNAAGIGFADIITQAAFDAVDRRTTWTNVLTSGSLNGGKIPLAMPSEREAILAAASCVPGVDARDARIVRIRDTLRLDHLAVSENLLPLVRAREDLAVVGPFAGWPG
ncbi:MAG TPA: hypothetical protein VEL07_06630 [Planctomycetota bacterium]|nr:hypothetical protein [Planctomycetota bacterium]